VRRREFITVVGGATVWPLVARAQQSAMPVIGFLNGQSPDAFTGPLRGFRDGLKEAGYVEGENVIVDYRWAENQFNRVPALAADLVRRNVAVIVTMGNTQALAAKEATPTIPIVFNVGDDPVRLGLVASLSRPGGNLTGVNFFTGELTAKRLELLRELVPGVTRIAVLVTPANPTAMEVTVRDAKATAQSMGLQIQILNANSAEEINAAFAALGHERPDALFVGSGPFFTARRVQLTQLAARHALPAIYATRQHPDVGGLMSYGASTTDAWHQLAISAGRILKGAKPAELPVVQSSKFELVINLQTARMLGIAVPHSLLARADEVIE
jgi:putative ABC transport system substrate-binding protein